MLTQPSQLNMFLWNANGLRGKSHELELLIQQHSPDIFAITETKLNPAISDKEVCSHDYTLYRFDRSYGTGPGGGVLIGVNNSSSIQVNSTSRSPLGEILALELNISGFSFVLAVYYHRPLVKNVDDIIDWYQGLQNPNVLILGDFNLPEIDWSSCQIKQNNNIYMHRSFLDFINSSDLIQHVDFPTHNKGNTLDLLLSNLEISNTRGEPSCSDHCIILFALDIKRLICRKNPSCNKAFWQFCKANIAEIILECHDLEEAVNSELSRSGTIIDNVWNLFKCRLFSIANSHIPRIKRKHKSKVWITRNTIQAIRKRRRLYSVNKTYPSPLNQIKLDDQNKLCRKLVNADYNNFINNYICDKLAGGESEPLFRFITSKKGSSNAIKKLDGCSDNDNTAIAETFADAFSTVFTTDNGIQLPVHLPRFSQVLPITINPQGVLKQLSVLDPRKGPGPDLLSPALLKFFSPYIYHTLTSILQYSLNTGTVPGDWRSAHVIPVFKKGNRADPLNYRPISLTSIISKLLEHIVSHNIHSHLEEHHLLTNCQHGFRSRHGCDTQLLNTVTDFVDSYDLGIPVDVAVLDFAKAFDVVSHPKLFQKIEAMGVHPSTCLWIRSWLECRCLSVTVNGAISSPRNVPSGVPQGSVLGPLLFLIFINDMPDFVKHSNIRLFADDSLLYLSDTTPDSSDLLQSDLDSLHKWAQCSQMKFNTSKCEHLRVCRESNRIEPGVVSLDGVSLSLVPQIKYLGVTIDNRLSFEQHILVICKKATGVLHMLMRNLKKARTKTRAHAYKTICRPILEFSTQVWSPHKLKDINNLEQINRKAFRWAYKYHKYDHISDSMLANGWQTLESRRNSFDIKLYMRIISNHAALDIDKFSLHHCNHDTRGGATVGIINTNVQKFSFKHRVHKLLN